MIKHNTISRSSVFLEQNLHKPSAFLKDKNMFPLGQAASHNVFRTIKTLQQPDPGNSFSAFHFRKWHFSASYQNYSHLMLFARCPTLQANKCTSALKGEFSKFGTTIVDLAFIIRGNYDKPPFNGPHKSIVQIMIKWCHQQHIAELEIFPSGPLISSLEKYRDPHCLECHQGWNWCT